MKAGGVGFLYVRGIDSSVAGCFKVRLCVVGFKDLGSWPGIWMGVVLLTFELVIRELRGVWFCWWPDFVALELLRFGVGFVGVSCGCWELLGTGSFDLSL
ncbi:hypothetical protein Droror1_Dr00017322 [Drosera rotundifolia]